MFHDPQKRTEIGHALRGGDWRWLALSWLVYGAVETLATVRWQILLRVQGIMVSWVRAGMIVTVGLFFNMLLPGLVGGDAMRLYLLFQKVPRKKLRGTLSVAMDRLLGLASLVVLAAMVVLLRFRWLNHVPQTTQITYLALGLLGGLTLSALLVFGVMGTRTLPRRLPFRHGIVEIGKALRLYREHPTMIVSAFLLTILSPSRLLYKLLLRVAVIAQSFWRRAEYDRFLIDHAPGEHNYRCADFLRRCGRA